MCVLSVSKRERECVCVLCEGIRDFWHGVGSFSIHT